MHNHFIGRKVVRKEVPCLLQAFCELLLIEFCNFSDFANANQNKMKPWTNFASNELMNWCDVKNLENLDDSLWIPDNVNSTGSNPDRDGLNRKINMLQLSTKIKTYELNWISDFFPILIDDPDGRTPVAQSQRLRGRMRENISHDV